MMNADTMIQAAQNSENLDEKLQCAFALIGMQVGDLIKCLVTQEIASNMNRINQLNNILNGNACDMTLPN